MHRPSDEPGPTCLVAGAQAGALSPWKLVEVQAIPPVWILLEFRGTTEDGSPRRLEVGGALCQAWPLLAC